MSEGEEGDECIKLVAVTLHSCKNARARVPVGVMRF